LFLLVLLFLTVAGIYVIQFPYFLSEDKKVYILNNSESTCSCYFVIHHNFRPRCSVPLKPDTLVLFSDIHRLYFLTIIYSIMYEMLFVNHLPCLQV
jgi:hypothetical protein